MSLLAKLFGGDKKGGKAPSPQDAIQRLREIEEMLQKKSDFLEKKVEQELATARKHGSKNKRSKIRTADLYVTAIIMLFVTVDRIEKRNVALFL